MHVREEVYTMLILTFANSLQYTRGFDNGCNEEGLIRTCTSVRLKFSKLRLSVHSKSQDKAFGG